MMMVMMLKMMVMMVMIFIVTTVTPAFTESHWALLSTFTHSNTFNTFNLHNKPRHNYYPL